MADLRRLLAKRGKPVEYLWTTERGPQGGALHNHAIARGTPVIERDLAKVWGGRVDVRNIRRIETSGTTNYLFKDGFTDLDTHLSLNNGRACHATRGFSGADFKTTAEAMKADLGLHRLDWSVYSQQIGTAVADTGPATRSAGKTGAHR